MADKLSTGASALPEATASRFASVAERFTSVAKRLETVDVSGGLARVKDTGGKLSEAVERDTDGAVSKLKDAGKTVGNGLSGVASATAGKASGVAGSLRDVVPGVQAGTSAFSSQVCRRRGTRTEGGECLYGVGDCVHFFTDACLPRLDTTENNMSWFTIVAHSCVMSRCLPYCQPKSHTWYRIDRHERLERVT